MTEVQERKYLKMEELKRRGKGPPKKGAGKSQMKSNIVIILMKFDILLL